MLTSYFTLNAISETSFTVMWQVSVDENKMKNQPAGIKYSFCMTKMT